jgi:TonB-dependent SusC/RagA subfamily outer membrane receptor
MEAVKDTYFHTVVDSFPTGKYYNEPLLLPGHYLLTYADGGRLSYELRSVSPLSVKVLNNQVDLSVWVADTLGRPVPDAMVKVKSRKIAFDPRTQTYRLRKTNRRGVMTVTHRGFTTYRQLDARPRSSWASKTGRKIYRYAGIGYVMKFFRDINASIRYHQPTGWLRGISQTFGDERYFEMKGKGYLVFNKPMYQPGDTVRFKAFVLNKRGKSVEKPLEVWLNVKGKLKKMTQLSPYRKGGYSFDFAISDSLGLKLDQMYTISLTDHQKNTYLAEAFRYEDYELKANTFKLRSEKERHHPGMTQALFAKGTDENDLNLMDARINVSVFPSQVHTPNQKVFVPDTLWHWEQPLDALGETRISLPDSIFPPVSMDYRVEAVFLTSNNERHSKNLHLSYLHQPSVILLRLEADSLVATLQAAGQSLSDKARLIAYADREEKVLFDKIIRLPHREKINPLAFSYEVEMNEDFETIAMQQEKAQVTLQASRTADSVFVQVENPRQIPFWYTIYRKSGELVRGTDTRLSFKARTTTRQNYFVSLQYVWGGQVLQEEYQIPFSTQQLHIEVNQPAVIYPGQKTRVDITVTDAEGKAAENVDLTAYAITRKLKQAYLPTLPSFEKKRRGRRSINSFTLKEKFGEGSNLESDADHPLDWTRWRTAMSLDTIAYYHFLYPSRGLFTHYVPTSDRTSQIAPFVVDKGVLQPACLIYLDNRLVYYKDTDAVPRYAFRLDSGTHSLRIRTQYKLIEYDSLLIQPGQKLIVSLDVTQPPAKARISDVPFKFTEQEQQLLNQYVMQVRPLPGQDLAYLMQDDFFQPLYFNANNHYYQPQPLIAGVFAPRQMQLNWENHPNTSFVFEPGYEYEFQEGLIKMRSVRAGKLFDYPIRWDTHSLVPNFREQAATKTEMDSLWRWHREEQSAEFVVYDNPVLTTAGFGRLSINRLDPATKRVKQVLLFRQDDPDFLRVYGGNSSTFEQLKPGRYKIVLLLFFNEYVVQDSVDIKPDGTNYQQIRETVVHPADDFSRKASESIGKAGYLFKSTLQDIKEQYNQTYNLYPPNQPRPAHFTHFVEGRVLDDSGAALPGVSVVVKGTAVGTATDAKGYYRLYTPANGVLVFSFIGYLFEEMLIGGRSVVEAKMRPDIKTLSEVVVVGYGTQRRRDLTGSVSGVTTSGVPGGAANIRIRGINTTAGGSSEPLIIIDGVPFAGHLSELDAATIAGMEVLQSATALALYGSRAANGVMMITTRKANVITPKSATPLLEAMAQGEGLRSRFSDYAYWQPRLTTNKDGKASFEATFPDDLTQWRTFVLAMDDRKRTGTAEASVKAFRPLTASLAVPRFLVRGDTVRAIGKTVNYTSDTLAVQTAFEVDGKPASLRSERIIYSLLDSILLSTSASDSVRVKYAVNKSDGYFDGELKSIPVVPLGTLETRGLFLNLDRDTTLTLPFDPALGPVKLYAQADALQILVDELDHVRAYEYLCNEQVASKLKALLLEKKVRAYLKQPFRYERDIQKLLRKLEDAQSKDGTWGWWPHSSFSHWISRHVAEALLAARKDGYSVRFMPQQLIDNLVYEMEGARRADQVQTLQLLQTLDAKVDYLRYTDRLSRDTTLSLQRRLQLIAIRQAAGLTYTLDTLFKHQQETVLGSLFWGKEQYYLHDNSVTNTVLAYRILRTKGGYETQLQRIRNYFLEKRQAGHWRNTYESALILETILPDLLNGATSIQPSRLRLSGAVSDTLVTVFPYEATFAASQRLVIRKEGTLPLYLTAYQQFQNTAPAKVEKDFVVKTSFEGQKTGKAWLEAGKPVVLKVEVEVKKEAEYVMIEVPIPAGCSYEDKRVYYGVEAYREYFRHKTSIFCQRLNQGKHEFTIRLLPRYSGSYTLNPAKAELMYYPVFYGRNEIKRVRVK